MLGKLALSLLALITLGLPTLADDLTLTGDVTYRERIALPPNAELWVTLVTLSDAGSVVSAAAAIGSPAQVPLQYSLHVRSGIVANGGDFGLVAEIRAEGRTLFRNNQPVPVDVTAPVPTMILVNMVSDPPHEAPEQVLPPPEPPVPLLDTAWRVIGIGGDPVLADTNVTLSIAADRRAGGNGGCNNYFTEATFGEPPLSFGPVAATRMACTPEAMTQEAALFAALTATVGYELAASSLTFFDAAGFPQVELVRLQ